MRAARLAALLAAGALCAAAGAAVARHADRLAAAHVHALAPQMFAQKTRGVAWQRAAFAAPDLLPVYGSSDVNTSHRFHASALFRDYPHGFTIFPVGTSGSASLNWLQALAAAGPAVQGERFAVLVPLRAFLSRDGDAAAYAGTFSRQHAYATIFTAPLSPELRTAIARRLLAHPKTLAGDPLLAFAVRQLASGTTSGRLAYWASVPLGRLVSAILALQDRWQTIALVRAQRDLVDPARRPAPLDWDALAAEAAADARARAANNRFGFDGAFWDRHAPALTRQANAFDAGTVRRAAAESVEWTDLGLLLRTIRELGGRPLLLALPLNPEWYDYAGVPPDVRAAIAARLAASAAAHGVPLVDFGPRAADPLFSADPAPHLSAVGWIEVNRALDAFVKGSS